MTTTYAHCKVDDCEARAESRGYCPKHYFRLKRTGTTDLLPRRTKYGHGTPQARQRHRRRGEEYCDECAQPIPTDPARLEAAREYDRQRREAARIGIFKTPPVPVWDRPFDDVEELPPHLARYIRARRARFIRRGRIAAMKARKENAS